MTDEIVLFDGQLGSQSVHVWLEARGAGIALNSQDIGPALESAFGSDEVETFLEIDAADIPTLTALLAAEHPIANTPGDPLELLEARYRGDSMATTHLRELLTAHGIPYRFSVI
jgi:hypothetical protein